MVGLRNRGALPSVVQDEFENLIARIKEFFLKEHNEDGTHIAAPASLAVVPIGAEMVWPTDTAPAGWLLARGQQVNRLKYKRYFDVVGTMFGVGDGSLTFNVPNIQGRTVYGKAVSGTGSTLGGTFGLMDHTHTGPSHAHGAGTLDVSGNTNDATLETSEVQSGTGIFVTNDGVHSHGSSGLGITGSTSSAGTGATGIANPPGISQNWIIYVGVA